MYQARRCAEEICEPIKTNVRISQINEAKRSYGGLANCKCSKHYEFMQNYNGLSCALLRLVRLLADKQSILA